MPGPTERFFVYSEIVIIFKPLSLYSIMSNLKLLHTHEENSSQQVPSFNEDIPLLPRETRNHTTNVKSLEWDDRKLDIKVSVFILIFLVILLKANKFRSLSTSSIVLLANCQSYRRFMKLRQEYLPKYSQRQNMDSELHKTF